MKNGRIRRFAVLSLFGAASTLFGTGCLNSLVENAWWGFGTALGAQPAQIVGEFILDALGLGGDDAGA